MSKVTISDDLLSDEAIADPYKYFGQLRELDPVHWNERHGSWLITRHDDVLAGFADPRFASNRLVPHFDKQIQPQEQSWLDPIKRILGGWMVFKDGPEHSRLRKSISRSFTPRSIERSRHQIASIVDQLLDSLQAHGELDFVKEFAFPLPAIVIAELFGAPPSDRGLFKELSDKLQPLVFGNLENPDRHEQAARALLDFEEYIAGLLDYYGKNPGDNLISSMVASKQSCELGDSELTATCVLILFGGHETTTNLLANGLRALLVNPDQAGLLQDNPTLARRGVEELLRYEGPAKLTVRLAGEDLEMRDRKILKGQRILLVQAAANRDPAVFDHPDNLVIERVHNPHVSFGFGPHFCLGAPLARLEAELAFTKILAKFPTMELLRHEPEWHRTMLVRGPKELWVKTGT
ncbi:MAG: cytochrome P450 [Actinobacteria bacterium]|nr:cytochrome P450 [Actinomycetota bacterium]